MSQRLSWLSHSNWSRLDYKVRNTSTSAHKTQLTNGVDYRQSASGQVQWHDRLRDEDREARRSAHHVPRLGVNHVAPRPMERWLFRLHLPGSCYAPRKSNKRQVTSNTKRHHLRYDWWNGRHDPQYSNGRREESDTEQPACGRRRAEVQLGSTLISCCVQGRGIPVAV